jgi:hypothetical protein
MLENLKQFLGISDSDRDAVLKLIISNATARLTLLLGGIEPPEELNHIILEVSIIRYNRIGSEGLSSHSVEGESLTYRESDFAAYMDEIDAFLKAQEESKHGKVRFI